MCQNKTLNFYFWKCSPSQGKCKIEKNVTNRSSRISKNVTYLFSIGRIPKIKIKVYFMFIRNKTLIFLIGISLSKREEGSGIELWLIKIINPLTTMKILQIVNL